MTLDSQVSIADWRTEVVATAACIVGVGETERGSADAQTALHLHQQAAKAALEDAGLRKDSIDGLFTCGADGLHALQVAEYLDLRPAYVDGTQVGGASWEVFVEHAAVALQAGRCTTALLVSGGTARADAQRPGHGESAVIRRGAAQFEAPYGLSLVGKFALAARRHMHEYGTTARQLASVAVSANRWAQLDPRAAAHGTPLALEDALRSRVVAEPLRQADCCLRTDGGAAVILTTAERARDLRRPPVRVLGSATAVAHLHPTEWDELSDVASGLSGRRALSQAGVNPGDVHLLQVPDAFSIMVLLALEGLGFCGRGEGGPTAESGTLAPGGALPTNTDGGGLAGSYPGTRGVLPLVEATRQLRGEGGAHQVAGARVAVCHGMGGYLASAATVVLGA